MNSSISPKFEVVWDFMAVLVSCKFEDDLIKSEGGILRTTFLHYKSKRKFFVTHGQVIPKWKDRSCPKSNLSEILWLFLFPESVRKICSKLKALSAGQVSPLSLWELSVAMEIRVLIQSQNCMLPFPHPNDATDKKLIKIGQLASEIFKFESVDDGGWRQTTMTIDGQRTIGIL